MGRTTNTETQKEKTAALMAEIEVLVTAMGLLVKRYLINSEYGERPFKIDVRWQEDLDQIYRTLMALHHIAERTIQESISQALVKYSVRKDLPQDQVPSFEAQGSVQGFFRAAYDYSVQLFREGTIEVDLFDFVTEVCELNEVSIAEGDTSSEDWLNELSDVTYLYLRLSMHSHRP